MAENVLHTTAPIGVVMEVIRRLPLEAHHAIGAKAMMTRCGIVLLRRIKEAFIEKSRGGTDDAGDSWAPLSPKTIMRRLRRGKGGRTATEKKRPDHPSQALSESQRNRWWELYKQGLNRYRDKDHGATKATKASAAKRAWFILKQEGAQTLLQKYGNAKVDILRDTGLLLNSLSPYGNSEHQVFTVNPGEVIVGTNRPGALAHHRGILGSAHEGIADRLPQRRLWPAPDRWPASWWLDITEEVKVGIVDMITNLMRTGTT